jgi:hypothetical protein
VRGLTSLAGRSLAARPARTLVCRQFPQIWNAQTGTVPHDDLLLVLKTFLDLQGDRQTADYDLTINFSRAFVADRIAIATKAAAAWQRVQATPEARAFLVALVARRGFSRR